QENIETASTVTGIIPASTFSSEHNSTVIVTQNNQPEPISSELINFDIRNTLHKAKNLANNQEAAITPQTAPRKVIDVIMAKANWVQKEKELTPPQEASVDIYKASNKAYKNAMQYKEYQILADLWKNCMNSYLTVRKFLGHPNTLKLLNGWHPLMEKKNMMLLTLEWRKNNPPPPKQVPKTVPVASSSNYIGDNKHQKFAFLPFKRQIKVNKVSPVNLQLEKFKYEQLKEAEISLHLTDKQENDLSSLLPHPPLLRRPAYPASPKSREALETHSRELPDFGVIRNVGHIEEVEITTPVIVAWHKGKSRMVGDFRALNTYTVPDRYPIPNIQISLTQISQAVYITTMDPLKGFHQNVVTPRARKSLRIIVHCGVYEYLRMPFGIKMHLHTSKE
ncbi:hypothetical protein O181_106179, partial [Austropuccinia psidii MF-1]|nr:hypothetical protein [Austropuccinia psidii MF-1]